MRSLAVENGWVWTRNLTWQMQGVRTVNEGKGAEVALGVQANYPVAEYDKNRRRVDHTVYGHNLK